jgi:hypothetical protein
LYPLPTALFDPAELFMRPLPSFNEVCTLPLWKPSKLLICGTATACSKLAELIASIGNFSTGGAPSVALAAVAVAAAGGGAAAAGGAAGGGFAKYSLRVRPKISGHMYNNTITAIAATIARTVPTVTILLVVFKKFD